MNREKRDEEIRAEIQLALQFLPVVEPGSVGVAVEAGLVTLTGRVADPSARQAAEQLARRVPGVRSVVNEIPIHRPSDDTKHEVSLVRAVADALGRGRRSIS